MSKRTVLISLALCTFAAMAIAQNVNKFAPKKDDTWAFRQKVTTDFAGTAIIYTSKMTYKVVQSDEKGYKASVTESERMLDMGDGGQPQGEGSVANVTYGPRGDILSVDGDAMADNPHRFASLFAFILPEADLAKGLKWEFTNKANKDIGSYETTYKYEVLESEAVGGVPAFKVKFSMEEKTSDMPGTNNGTVWLDATTARPLKATSKFANASIQGMTFGGDWELTSAK